MDKDCPSRSVLVEDSATVDMRYPELFKVVARNMFFTGPQAPPDAEKVIVPLVPV